MTKNDQFFKRWAYICLSLSTILISSEVQATGGSKKNPPVSSGDGTNRIARQSRNYGEASRNEGNRGNVSFSSLFGNDEGRPSSSLESLFRNNERGRSNN